MAEPERGAREDAPGADGERGDRSPGPVDEAIGDALVEALLDLEMGGHAGGPLTERILAGLAAASAEPMAEPSAAALSESLSERAPTPAAALPRPLREPPRGGRRERRVHPRPARSAAAAAGPRATAWAVFAVAASVLVVVGLGWRLGRPAAPPGRDRLARGPAEPDSRGGRPPEGARGGEAGAGAGAALDARGARPDRPTVAAPASAGPTPSDADEPTASDAPRQALAPLEPLAPGEPAGDASEGAVVAGGPAIDAAPPAHGAEAVPGAEAAPSAEATGAPPGASLSTTARAPARLGTVTRVVREARVQVGEAAPRRLREGDAIEAGSTVLARGSIDLDLESGGFARLKGEVEIEEAASPTPADAPASTTMSTSGAALALRLAEGSALYVDRTWPPAPTPAPEGGAAAPRPALVVEVAGRRATVGEGAALVADERGRAVIACFTGAVRAGDLDVPTGAVAASGGAPGAPDPLALAPFDEAALARRFPLLARRPERLLERFTFALRPAGLTAGRVEGGLARADGDGGSIELDLAVDRPAPPGLVIRLALRAEGVDELVLQVWAPVEKRNYRRVLTVPPAPRGGFAVVEVPLAALRQTLDPSVALAPGTRLRNLQLHAYGARARLEVESVELRARP